MAEQDNNGWLDSKNIVHTNDAQARLFQKDRLAQRLRKLEHDAALALEELETLSSKEATKRQKEINDRDARLRRQSPGSASDRLRRSEWG